MRDTPGGARGLALPGAVVFHPFGISKRPAAGRIYRLDVLCYSFARASSSCQASLTIMEDAEYPAYLKQQSYEDLLSVSHSIDRQAQAKRHAMVMADLAQRDKSDGGKESANVDKKCRKKLSALIGALFAIMAAFEILTGRAFSRYHHDIDVTTEPVRFWMTIGFHLACATSLLCFGLIEGREDL